MEKANALNAEVAEVARRALRGMGRVAVVAPSPCLKSETWGTRLPRSFNYTFSQENSIGVAMRFTLSIAAFMSPLLLTGCGTGALAPATPVQPGAIQGIVHGGQQAVVGAHVYLYAANTAGYNIGAATYGSVSLLTSSVLTNEPSSSGKDSSGNYYVTTDATGSFNISNDYSCTPDSNGVPGQQVYLYAVGGNPGSGTNPAASFMAILGDCPAIGNFFIATPYVWMNEVSTVAAAYAMAGFAYDSTHVSSSGTSLAKVGIENAFANASNLVTLATGVPLTVTPAGNGTVPQSLIITLANTLAACVNSQGLVTGPTTPTTCYTLFTNAESNGSTGTEPTDTATAAINIAHNPGSNVNALYVLQTGMPAFGKGLTTQPNDFTMGLKFTGGGLSNTEYIAIDSSGNVWTSNFGTTAKPLSVSKFSSLGVALSPSTGYTGGGLNHPQGIAIDDFGYVWVADAYTGAGVSKFTNAGVPVPYSPCTGGGTGATQDIAMDGYGDAWMAEGAPDSVFELSNTCVPVTPSGGLGVGGGPLGIAVDGTGNAWSSNSTDNSLSEYSNTGVAMNGGHPYYGGGLNFPYGMAIDSAGSVWVADNGYGNGASISKFSNSGVPLSGTSGFTGGGLFAPLVIAIDGSGNVWTQGGGGVGGAGNLSEFTNAGVAMSPTTGYYASGALEGPISIAVDGSGNVWTSNVLDVLSEVIGAATPVITPISAGLPLLPTADGSSNLGTRP